MAILETRDHGKTFHIVTLTPEAEQLDPPPEDRSMTDAADRLPLLQDIDVADALTRTWRTGSPSLLSDIYFNTGTRSGWRNVFIFRTSQHRVAAIYEDITRSKEAQHHQQQSRKLEALGTLARGVSHEMNNILMAISGFTALALSRCEDARIRSYLEHIEEGYSRAESLVRQLRFFTRTQNLCTEPLHLDIMARECLQTFKATVPESLEVVFNIDQQLHRVMGDPELLHQMLMQLLHNAGRAAGEGDGRLMVRIDNIDPGAVPLLSERSEPAWVRIEIRDSGPGLPPNIRDRIFDPFFTTHPEEERRGLGLAVVHGIVQAHNGHLSVDASPGHGSSFQVLLPGASPETDCSPPPSPQSIGGNPAHILIIDDQPELLLLQQEGLGELGFRTTCCTNGAEGVHTFMQESDTIDIVLVDYGMPGMNGLQVAEKIHAASPSPPPILLCTGLLPVDGHNYQDLPNITDILYKPVSIATLASRLRDLLDTATKDGS